MVWWKWGGMAKPRGKSIGEGRLGRHIGGESALSQRAAGGDGTVARPTRARTRSWARRGSLYVSAPAPARSFQLLTRSSHFGFLAWLLLLTQPRLDRLLPASKQGRRTSLVESHHLGCHSLVTGELPRLPRVEPLVEDSALRRSGCWEAFRLLSCFRLNSWHRDRPHLRIVCKSGEGLTNLCWVRRCLRDPQPPSQPVVISMYQKLV